jgi:predicted dehydrogenase
VSLALHLFGALPEVVTASGGAWGRAREDNEATAHLQFGGARAARIHVARFSTAKLRETSIAGTAATLTFDELAPPDQSLFMWTPQSGRVVVPVDRRDALTAQCLDFADCVARGDARGGNGTHAADVVRILEAGERSMRQASTEAA